MYMHIWKNKSESFTLVFISVIILQVRAQSQNKSIYLSLPSMLIPDSFRVVHAESQNSFVLGVF